MLRKLDILIIKAFIGPFVATFFITLLVLVMQFFWLYIDDFVGKGLGTSVILEFIWYQSAALIPLALPLAILLSSLMTFGNLGESFELVAIKSAGISLLRFMRPLFILTIFLCGIAFMFANYIIPVANLKSRTLLGDIVFAKPAFDLKEGVFYDKLNGFSIKIGKKEANDSVIKDIIVYEQGNMLQDNFIIARNGVMRVSPNRRYLEFNLHDGWRYQERDDGSGKSQYIRLHFREYKKEFDLSSFQFSRTPDSANKNNEKMYSMRQLETAIDSMEKENRQMEKDAERELYRQLGFTHYIDSAWTAWTPPDSVHGKKIKTLNDLLPDSAKLSVGQRAVSPLTALRVSIESMSNLMKEKEKVVRRHKIEWHRKISLSLACLVLFLVGAPLGSIIRKGGLGTPLIFAIIFFMIFYFANTTGEKFAIQNSLSPFQGMWMATLVLGFMGLFLVYKAMRDSHLFDKEFYYRVTRNISRFFRKNIFRQPGN